MTPLVTNQPVHSLTMIFLLLSFPDEKSRCQRLQSIAQEEGTFEKICFQSVLSSKDFERTLSWLVKFDRYCKSKLH